MTNNKTYITSQKQAEFDANFEPAPENEIAKKVTEIIRQTIIHIIAKGHGFGYARDGESNMNSLTLEDLPLFIKTLQEDHILPDNGAYIQYSIGALSDDEQRRGEVEKRSKIIIFDKDDNALDIIPHQDILAFQEDWLDTELREGLKEEGFARIVRAML